MTLPEVLTSWMDELCSRVGEESWPEHDAGLDIDQYRIVCPLFDTMKGVEGCSAAPEEFSPTSCFCAFVLGFAVPNVHARASVRIC